MSGTMVGSLELSPSGPRVSRLVLGLWRLADWRLSSAELIDLLEACLDLGIDTFDHADIYGDYSCEALFGEALSRRPELRRRIRLVTKCGIKLVSRRRPDHGCKHYDTSRAHIVGSVDASLAALGVDHVDLLLIHRPDPLLDADEVAAAFGELRRAGKVRHFGVSNFTPAQLELLRSRLEADPPSNPRSHPPSDPPTGPATPLVTNQVEISPLRLAPFLDGTLDQCQRLRIAPMAWSPLAGGRLFSGDDERGRRVRGALAAVGDELGGAGPDQVAYAWLLAHPARIVPVLGSGRIERLRAAAEATRLRLSREQWFRVWTASAGAEVP